MHSFSWKCTELWILSSGKYFLYKNLLALCLQIWAFLKIDQLYLQICLNILYVSFHWSSKNVKAFIHVFEVSWKEPKIFTFIFQADFKMFRGPDQKSVRATYGPRLPIYALMHPFLVSTSFNLMILLRQSHQNSFFHLYQYLEMK